ncbi:unannotated protein [freshwater metagenome]|uniref:Unannotated protein n=1 Tax=freshwater metagenome TaxID=449393 RepID=A0A6J6ZNZ8_9ZZZZ
MITIAEPPSLICEALAAVIVPSLVKAGLRLPNDSIVVLARTPSSVVTSTGSPLRCGIATGTISSANLPAAMAAAARTLLFIAVSSCWSRVMAPALKFSVPVPISTDSNAQNRPSLMIASASSVLP